MNYSDLCKNYGFNNSIMKEFDKKKNKTRQKYSNSCNVRKYAAARACGSTNT